MTKLIALKIIVIITLSSCAQQKQNDDRLSQERIDTLAKLRKAEEEVEEIREAYKAAVIDKDKLNSKVEELENQKKRDQNIIKGYKDLSLWYENNSQRDTEIDNASFALQENYKRKLELSKEIINVYEKMPQEAAEIAKELRYMKENGYDNDRVEKIAQQLEKPYPEIEAKKKEIALINKEIKKYSAIIGIRKDVDMRIIALPDKITILLFAKENFQAEQTERKGKRTQNKYIGEDNKILDVDIFIPFSALAGLNRSTLLPMPHDTGNNENSYTKVVIKDLPPKKNKNQINLYLQHWYIRDNQQENGNLVQKVVRRQSTDSLTYHVRKLNSDEVDTPASNEKIIKDNGLAYCIRIPIHNIKRNSAIKIDFAHNHATDMKVFVLFNGAKQANRGNNNVHIVSKLEDDSKSQKELFKSLGY